MNGIVLGLVILAAFWAIVAISGSFGMSAEEKRRLMGTRRFPIEDVATAINHAERLGYKLFWKTHAEVPMTVDEARTMLDGWKAHKVVLEPLPRTPDFPFDRLVMKSGQPQIEGYEARGAWTKVDRKPIGRSVEP